MYATFAYGTGSGRRMGGYKEVAATPDEKAEAVWRIEEELCMSMNCTRPMAREIRIDIPSLGHCITTQVCVECADDFLSNAVLPADAIVRMRSMEVKT